MESINTPLVRAALVLREQIQDTLFHYPQPFYWNDVGHKMELISNQFSLLPWFFVNFFLLQWVAIFNSGFVLCCYSLNIYSSLNILQIFILLLQAALGMLCSYTAYNIYIRGASWVSFFNQIFNFPRANQNLIDSFLASYSKDKFGCFIFVTMVLTVTMYFTIPVFVCIFELDAPYHFFKIIFPPAWYKGIWSRLLIFLLRSFIGTWCIADGLASINIFVIYAFILFRYYVDKLQRLKQHRQLVRNYLRQYNLLRLLFIPMNESLSLLLPTYLAVTYCGLLITNCICILGFNVVPWQFYVSIPFAGSMAICMLVVLWKMTTIVNDESNKLKVVWMSLLSIWYQKTTTLAIRKDQLLQGRSMKREVMALQPLSINYGTFGSMTFSTRRNYYYSLMVNSTDFILAMKGYGLLQLKDM